MYSFTVAEKIFNPLLNKQYESGVTLIISRYHTIKELLYSLLEGYKSAVILEVKKMLNRQHLNLH